MSAPAEDMLLFLSLLLRWLIDRKQDSRCRIGPGGVEPIVWPPQPLPGGVVVLIQLDREIIDEFPVCLSVFLCVCTVSSVNPPRRPAATVRPRRRWRWMPA